MPDTYPVAIRCPECNGRVEYVCHEVTATRRLAVSYDADTVYSVGTVGFAATPRLPRLIAEALAGMDRLECPACGWTMQPARGDAP